MSRGNREMELRLPIRPHLAHFIIFGQGSRGKIRGASSFSSVRPHARPRRRGGKEAWHNMHTERGREERERVGPWLR